jgi:Fic family protein
MSLRGKYPQIRFERTWALDAELSFALGASISILEGLKNSPILPSQRQSLMELALIRGARATTAIEGNLLSEEEVRQIYERRELLREVEPYQKIEVENILRAFKTVNMRVLEQRQVQLINEVMLKEFNSLIGEGLGEAYEGLPGHYRVGDRHVGQYYKCPDPTDVPELMRAFYAWLASEFHFAGGQDLSTVIVEAIVAHALFELIHPFGDGNGRTGRLLEFYILLRGGVPDVAAHLLSNYYNKTREQYYHELVGVSQTRTLQRFILYAAKGFHSELIGLQKQVAEGQVEIAWKQFVFLSFEQDKQSKAAKRKRDLLLGIPVLPYRSYEIKELLGSFAKISAVYGSQVSLKFRRDLEDLVEMNLLVRNGSSYALALGQLGSYYARLYT